MCPWALLVWNVPLPFFVFHNLQTFEEQWLGFVTCPSIWVCLMSFHNSTQVMHFGWEYDTRPYLPLCITLWVSRCRSHIIGANLDHLLRWACQAFLIEVICTFVICTSPTLAFKCTDLHHLTVQFSRPATAHPFWKTFCLQALWGGEDGNWSSKEVGEAWAGCVLWSVPN